MFSKVTRLLAFVVLVELFCVDAVPIDKFYPFGAEHGDTALAKYAREISTSEVSLRVPVKFYGYEYNLLYISGNGLISFLIALPEFISLQFPLSYPVITALYANVDSRGSGQVFYRETTDASLLLRANNEIYQAFPHSASSFRATSLFVVTWYQVSPSIRSEKKNTFQVVIASNGAESFVEFLYADDGIQWIQGEGAPGTGTLGAIAQAGLTAYDGRSHTLQGSGTDQIRHLTRLSNFNEAGVWIFRCGNIERTGNIEEPDKRLIVSQQVAISTGEMSCSTAFSLCHSQATCVDTNQKFCCTCRKGFYGNGYNCLKEGVPLRANGKVNLNVNGIHVTNQDIQVYIMPSDGKVYAALSKIPQSIGNLLQVIYPVTGMLNWLFAIPTSNGLNGFQITGGVLEHSADIIFRNTSDRISVVQKFFGVFDHLKMEMQIQGRVPTEALGRPEANDYQMQFNFVAPGLFKSSSSSIIYKTTSPITSEVVEHQISLEQTIKFNESCALDFNSAQAGVKGQYSYYRVKTARTFITYEGPENILRFSATSKVSLLTENDDPCIEGRIKCVANSSCVVEGDSFRCLCNSGFQTTYSRRYNEDINNDFGCLDVNECAEGKANCHENAMCVNEIGSYHCSCKPGYTGDGYTCTEIDNPCGSDFRLCNPPNSYCRVPNDHRTCDCTQGYQKTYINERRIAFTCIDVDECERNACGPYANCRNLPGSYSCECKPGYVGDGYQCQRVARNECELNSCGPNSVCRNSGDSFKCECKPGYFGNGYQCYRANVSCNMETNCSPNGECILNETSQSYVCQCIRGYYGDGYQCQAYGGRPVVQLLCSNSACWCPPNFVATGEWCVERTYYDTLPQNVSLSCFVLPTICHPNAMCIHNATTDQYYCACNSGYDGSGHECAEMETSCLQRSDICDQHATCRVNNRTGKASCVCNPQYQGDGLVCNQIEMCLTDSDCKANEECYYNENVLAYDCRCKRGYAKAADGSCQVIRNCPKCYPTASCVTDVVSGRDFCQCPPGFRGDGVTFCEETPLTCNPTEYNCSSFATCDFNLTSASYECHCKRGFVGDGINCVRATNCFDMPDICDRNARCVSLSPPYGSSYAPPVIQCQCKSGYIGNGTFCYEIPAHEGGFLFVNWGPTILRVPYEPSVTNPGYAIQTEANQIAIGLTIDCQRNRVFWSDYSGKKIKSATFKGKNVFTVVSGNITAPEGLAVDWLNQAIYWTDSGKKVVEAVNLDGTNRRVVIAKNLTNPRGIAVEPYRKKLFWSDWNRAQPKIEWSNLDGSDRATFVSGPDVQLPNSVTIDVSSDELCWADAGIKRIMCIGIETRLPRMITAHCVSPFGLTVSSTRYFWTEKSIGKVGYYDKITSRSGNITLPATGTGTVYGIVNVPIEC